MACRHVMRGNGTAELSATELARVPRTRDRVLERGEHIVLVDERQLDVELRELRLAIRAKVLVAHAVRELEIAVEARDHAELLVQLRRLRQRVEAAR